jgi:hypothetical protein
MPLNLLVTFPGGPARPFVSTGDMIQTSSFVMAREVLTFVPDQSSLGV